MKINKRKLITYTLSFLMIAVSIWLLIPWNRLEAQDDEQRKTLSNKGLNFNLPEDWPIEEHGGAVGPVPIEEYIAIKFRKVDTRFEKMETETQSFSQEIKNLGERMKTLETTVSDIDARLKDLEQWLKFGNARQL